LSIFHHIKGLAGMGAIHLGSKEACISLRRRLISHEVSLTRNQRL
jgi:hypothetical protein